MSRAHSARYFPFGREKLGLSHAWNWRALGRALAGASSASFCLLVSPASSAITHSYNADGTPVDTRWFVGNEYYTPSIAGGGFDLSGVAYIRGNFTSCTASLISPTVLLTAAHCLEANSYAVFPRFGAGYFIQPPEVIAISRFVPYPTYDVAGPDKVQPNDIGLAFLSTPASGAVYRIATDASIGSILGSTAMFAGYGIVSGGVSTTWSYSTVNKTYAYADPTGYEHIGLPQLRAGYNTVEGVANDGTVFLTDFDGFNGAGVSLSRFGNRGLGTFEVGTSPGDSGSGVFTSPLLNYAGYCVVDPSAPICRMQVKLLSSTPTLIGVTSFAQFEMCGNDLACQNRFNTVDGYTFVGPYAGWIGSMVPDLQVLDLPPQLIAPEGTFAFDFQPSDFYPVDPLPPMDGLGAPEPPSLALLATGLLAAAIGRRASSASTQTGADCDLRSPS